MAEPGVGRMRHARYNPGEGRPRLLNPRKTASGWSPVGLWGPGVGALLFSLPPTLPQTIVCSLGHDPLECPRGAAKKGAAMVPENWGKRMEMLRHLARLSAGGGGAPTVRELGEAVGLRSSPKIGR